MFVRKSTYNKLLAAYAVLQEQFMTVGEKCLHVIRESNATVNRINKLGGELFSLTRRNT